MACMTGTAMVNDRRLFVLGVLTSAWRSAMYNNMRCCGGGVIHLGSWAANCWLTWFLTDLGTKQIHRCDAHGRKGFNSTCMYNLISLQKTWHFPESFKEAKMPIICWEISWHAMQAAKVVQPLAYLHSCNKPLDRVDTHHGMWPLSRIYCCHKLLLKLQIVFCRTNVAWLMFVTGTWARANNVNLEGNLRRGLVSINRIA